MMGPLILGNSRIQLVLPDWFVISQSLFSFFHQLHIDTWEFPNMRSPDMNPGQ